MKLTSQEQKWYEFKDLVSKYFSLFLLDHCTVFTCERCEWCEIGMNIVRMLYEKGGGIRKSLINASKGENLFWKNRWSCGPQRLKQYHREIKRNHEEARARHERDNVRNDRWTGTTLTRSTASSSCVPLRIFCSSSSFSLDAFKFQSLTLAIWCSIASLWR